MKNLINTIENNTFLNDAQKEIMIDAITLGNTVSIKERMRQIEIKMAMLEALYNADDELTITEILNASKCYCTVQRMSAMAKQLNEAGLINKNYILTGNSLIFRGRKEPERIAKFSFKKA